MRYTNDVKTDCEVCTRLIKEKHRHSFFWKIACLFFAVLAVVFAILYFGSGALTTETTVTIDNIGNNNEITDNSGTVIIGNEGELVTGTVEQTDYTPIVCISTITSAFILVIGGAIVAHNFQKKD